MNFDSAFFLFCLLPPLLTAYLLVRNNTARNIILLVAGLVFYSFGCLFDLAVLLVMAGVTFLAGKLIRREWRPRAALIAGVVFDLLVLITFKLAERLTVTVTGPDGALRLLFARVSPVVIGAPLGVSFFAFKCVSYLADARRDREQAAGSFWRFLLYVSFFPEIVSGPISRYKSFAPQLNDRSVTVDGAALGLRRFILGLGKKLFLAGAAASVADGVFGFTGTVDIRLAWLGAIAYSLQLFFDFSGYSDMAIGLAAAFGFVSPENFNYPYASVSITDFWRRWHISLSHWFRDYVYIPLGGNRKGKYRTALNKFTVFVLCGLWHGLGWTYLIWGVWHGLLSALESLKIFNIERWRGNKYGAVLSRVYTLLAVALGFVMFRAAGAGQGFRIIGAMFAGFKITSAGTALLYSLLNGRSIALLALGAVSSIPTASCIKARLRGSWGVWAAWGVYAVLLLLCMTELAAGGFAPFIYAQF